MAKQSTRFHLERSMLIIGSVLSVAVLGVIVFASQQQTNTSSHAAYVPTPTPRKIIPTPTKRPPTPTRRPPTPTRRAPTPTSRPPTPTLHR